MKSISIFFIVCVLACFSPGNARVIHSLDRAASRGSTGLSRRVHSSVGKPSHPLNKHIREKPDPTNYMGFGASREGDDGGQTYG
ncbi:hypothetical protein PGT21_027539 [Puccinia graminis f. sp. tritici]|uniref:Uncharacterized protein n=1 Tax=Puccinia graminis f. sp. tritici TaxID=56615 RepID=A0A5B0P908_PUCGR|nr:hypothetical protein PGT21_027539 [Puccinia graminis f. sp. tritici]KAA1116980.1 hypothetical protein PGTUg99_032924 [Puccinia graminis f. sp. tritici]